MAEEAQETSRTCQAIHPRHPEAAARVREYNKSNGLLSKVTDANGNVTRYEYNGNMKNTAVTLPDGSTISYTYDGEVRQRTSPTIL